MVAEQFEGQFGIYQDGSGPVSRCATRSVCRAPPAVSTVLRSKRPSRGSTFSGSFYYEQGQFAVIDDPNTGAARLLAQLGMTLSPRVTTGVTERSASLEQIELLDADFVYMGFATDDLRAALTANPLYQGLTAVRDDRVVEADVELATAGNNPSILKVPWQLEQFRPVLERVAATA